MRYYVHQFSDKMNNFEFLGLNLPKNGFCGWNFKNLGRDSESATWRYYVHQFSNNANNFEVFSPNLPRNEFSIEVSKI